MVMLSLFEIKVDFGKQSQVDSTELLLLVLLLCYYRVRIPEAHPHTRSFA